MVKPARPNSIYVVAGVNGAGKSSVISAPFVREGLDIFDPDVETRSLMQANPGLPLDQANSLAWNQGRAMLERAVEHGLNFAFETTLGGQTIAGILIRALALGQAVRLLYVGLESPELHIARVRTRVAAGGHDVPGERIRRRYDSSRDNLITLLPHLTELRLFDNSEDADPLTGAEPQPVEVLRMLNGAIIQCLRLEHVPNWAKPIVATALELPRTPPEK